MKSCSFSRWASVLTFCLGVMFFAAAFSKIGNLADFYLTLEPMGIFPSWSKGWITLFIPGLELVLGFCLITGTWLREALLLSSVLLLFFLGYVIYLVLSGHSTDCGCFKITVPLPFQLTGSWIIVRDGLLFVASLFCLIAHIRYNEKAGINR